MLGSNRRIFAGKGNLRTEPFCPFITNETGYSVLRRIAQTDTGRQSSSFGGHFQAEPTFRIRKPKA